METLDNLNGPHLTAQGLARNACARTELSRTRTCDRPEVWLRLACEAAIVRRACGYAVIVGAVLITINHGDAILAGDVDGLRVAKMGLTVLVPYVVSTLSSMGAIRALRR